MLRVDVFRKIWRHYPLVIVFVNKCECRSRQFSPTPHLLLSMKVTKAHKTS